MSYNSKIQILIEAIDQASTQLQNVGNSVSGLSNKIGSLGETAKIAAGVLLGQLARDALNALTKAAGEASSSFMAYEQTLTKIVSATSATGKEAMELTRALALVSEAQTDLGFSAADSARGLEALVKAGMSGTDAAKALRSALSLAALESISTEKASNLLVQTLTMFGLKAEDSAGALNSLSKAADAGIDTASGYASGLANAGAAAHNMGLSLDETLAALIQLDKTYGSATESGTYLNSMFKDLIAKSDKLGITLYNQDGTMKNLAEIIGELRGKVKSFGDDQEAVNQYLSVFDVRAQRAVIGLLNYDGSIEDTMADMRASRDVQEKMNMIMDTTAGKTAKLEAEMENASYALGQMTSEMTLSWKQFALGLGPIGAVANALGPSLLQGAISGFMIMLPTLITSLGGLSGVMHAVGVAAHAMLGPIGLVIAAITLLATAYATNFMGIRDKVDGFIAWLGPAWNNMVSTLTTAWTNFWNGAKAFIQDPVGTIKSTVQNLADTMQTKFEDVYTDTGNIWKATWETLKTIPVLGSIVSAVEGLGNKILSVFGGSMDNVFDAWQGAWQSIQNFIHDPIGSIKSGVSDLGSWLQNSFSGFMGKVKETWNTALNVLAEKYPETANLLKSVQSGFSAFMSGDWYNLGKSIRETVMNLVPALKEMWSNGLDALKTVSANAWTWLQNSFSSGLNSILSFFSTITPKIKEAFINGLTAIQNFVVDFVRTLPQRFSEGLTSLVNAVLNFGPRVIQAFSNALNGIVTAIKDFFRGLVGGSIWTDGLQSLLNVGGIIFGKIKDVISSLLNQILGIFGLNMDNVVSVWQGAWQNLKNFVASPIGAIQSAVSGFTGWLGSAFYNGTKTATDVWNGFWNGVKSLLGSFLPSIQSSVSSFTGGLGSAFYNGTKTAVDVWNGFWNGVQNIASGFISNASTWGKNLASNLISGIRGQVANVQSVASQIGNTVKSSISTFISNATSWGSSLLSNFVSGIKSKLSSLSSTIQSIGSTIASWLGFGSVPEKGPLHDLMKWGPALTEQFAEGILSGLPKVTKAAESVAGAFSGVGQLGGGGFTGGFAQGGSLQFNAPLVVIQGDASEDTAKLAADLILKNIRKYVVS